MPIRVVVVGLGPIGAGVAAQIVARPGFELVGGVDVDPAKVGVDVGVVTGGHPIGIEVVPDASEAGAADAIVACTASSLVEVTPQIEALLALRLPIVSTTEELSYPWRDRSALAQRIDDAAKRAGVAVVGTGVNPGFAMDALPIALTAICARVESVHVDRIQDARIRRLPFQQKIGAGLAPAEFAKRVAAGTVRHVGLAESIAMIADALGWTIDRITDDIQPKIAELDVASDLLVVKRGQVCGIIQDGTGYVGDRAAITLHMEAYLGAPENRDAVRITGSPDLHVVSRTGYHGDLATTSITVNTIPKVIAASPGLHTMRSLALPSFAGGPIR